MSKNISNEFNVSEGVIASLLALFVIYILSCAVVGVLSLIYFGGKPISSSFLWNIFLANFVTIFSTFVFVKMSYKSKLIATFIFLIASGLMGTYKLSTIAYYMNSNYHELEYYPENSEQRKIVTAIIENKDNAFLGKYDWGYLQKVDISKLGNMTNFFLIYGTRNEEIKKYETEFKVLLNKPFVSVWDYSEFENKIIDYLTSNSNALQKNESVSMLYTIKFGV